MRSLQDAYADSPTGTHETVADLMFCALVVLVLFVLALAIEVSDRVRAELAADTIEKAKSQGSQQFSGAREPASLNVAYDYREQLYYFLPARQCKHAVTRQSSETEANFQSRKSRELMAIAEQARGLRGYTLDEATAIYQGFSQYKEVEPTDDSYRTVDSKVGIRYIIDVCCFLSGDRAVGSNEATVVRELLKVYETPGPAASDIYPCSRLEVDPLNRTIIWNGIQLAPSDAREILLSIDGRGTLLDVEGFSGDAPDWLREKVLVPAGYFSEKSRE
ncbi:MAG: hypothetical protein AAF497_06680 [Planctomycetota bacterium]